MKNWFCLLMALTLSVNSIYSQVSYEKHLEIPEYNPSDPSMMLIETNEDWGAIDDAEKTYFFVIPGDYTGLENIVINSSGTSETPRWLIYHDPENPTDFTTHPINMSSEKRAEFERISIRGSYWIVDRLYGTATEGSKNPTFELRESNIIINRVLCQNGGGGAGQISIAGSEIVIQNSVIGNTQIINNNDIHAVKISEGFDVRIVNNEIYNFAGDGIQLGDKPESFKGMVIFNNDFYIDVTLYPEEVSEIPHENAIDIKQSGVPGNTQNYVLIKNNRFRNIAHSPGGTSPNVDQGTIDFSNKPDSKTHVLVEGNIFYDCKIPFDTKGGGSTSNFTIRKNLIYNATRFGFWVPDEPASNHEFSFNTIIGVEQFEGDRNWINTPSENLEIYGNLILDGGSAVVEEGNYTSDYNVFFNTSATPSEGSNSVILNSIETSDFEDFCYEFRRLTNSETLCIPNAQPTQSADFAYLTADQYFGETDGIGVSDESYNQDWVGAIYPASTSGFPVLNFLSLFDGDTVSDVLEIEMLATDENSDLSNVQLLLDGEALGDLITSEPYNYSWDTELVSDGSYKLKARATDEQGNITYSKTLNIYVNNLPDSAPVISLVSPSDNETVANTVIVSATASDPDGDLVGVQFMLGDAELGLELFNAPFEREWITNAVSDGDYQIWAKARDYGGRVVETNPIQITVDNSYPPLVSISNLSNNELLSGEVEIQTDVSDQDDDVISVKFTVNDELLGADTESPYSFIWDTKIFENDDYKLIAIAEDADGNVVPSRAVFVEVSNEIILSQEEALDGLTLFPNPAEDQIFIRNVSEEYYYTIYTLSGIEITRGTSKPDQPIAISNISEGLYIVKVENADLNPVTFKFLKSSKE